MQEFDVIVVGAGHAGCEAALAPARMGLKTAIFTISLDKIGYLSCNYLMKTFCFNNTRCIF